jgi:hypothetical protein
MRHGMQGVCWEGGSACACVCARMRAGAWRRMGAHAHGVGAVPVPRAVCTHATHALALAHAHARTAALLLEQPLARRAEQSRLHSVAAQAQAAALPLSLRPVLHRVGALRLAGEELRQQEH